MDVMGRNSILVYYNNLFIRVSLKLGCDFLSPIQYQVLKGSTRERLICLWTQSFVQISTL
jgi:hypothetical protein